jgi:hypothetical protein
MPLNRVPLAGNQIVAMANVSLELKESFTAGGGDTTFTFNELNVLGLPSLTYWIQLSSATPNVNWVPLFAITNTTTGGVTSPNWHPFNNGFLLVPGNVTTFFVRSAVALAGMRITVPAGSTADVVTVITAGG